MSNKPSMKHSATSQLQGIPFLTTSPSNIGEVKNLLNNWVLRNTTSFGEAISVNKLQEIAVIPEVPVDLSIYQPDQDPGGFRANAYKENWKKNKEDIKTRKKEQSQLYGVVMSILPNSSKELVLSDPDYDAIQTSLNGFDLWKLVYKLHTTGSTQEPAASRKDAATQFYHSLSQAIDTDTATHYYNFRLAIQKLTDLGIDAPSEADQTIRFLRSLNTTMNSDFINQMNLTLSLNPTAFPATPRLLFHACINHQPFIVRSTKTEPTVMHTKQKKHKEQRKPPSSGNQKPSGKNGKLKRSRYDASKYCEFHKTNGHSTSDCKAKKATETVTAGLTTTTRISDCNDDEDVENTFNGWMAHSSPPSDDIYLDNGAEISIVKDANLITNINTCTPIFLKGITSSKSQLRVSKKGFFKNIIEVYYHPDASGNVLSYSQLDKLLSLQWDPVTKTFYSADGNLVFQQKGRLYAYMPGKTFNCLTTKSSSTNVPLAIKMLGYPSELTLANASRTGSIANMPFTVKDIEDTLATNGRNIASHQGKATTKKTKSLPLVSTPKLTTRELELSIDIAFIEGEPYLFSVSSPLDLTMVNVLINPGAKSIMAARSTPNLRSNLYEQLSKYHAHGFRITSVICDGEGGFRGFFPDLEAIKIRVVSGIAADHPAPKVDRRIRSIKESMRASLAGLPFNTPKSWLKYLVLFTVTRFNLFPHSPPWSGASPRELFSGVKTDFRRDVRIYFGEYTQCEVSYPDNTMEPRSMSCIALYPTGSLSGSCKFMVLKTMKVIAREKWASFPPPDSIITYINTLASEGGRIPTRDPVFAIGAKGVVVPDEADITSSTAARSKGRPPHLAPEADQRDVPEVDPQLVPTSPRAPRPLLPLPQLMPNIDYSEALSPQIDPPADPPQSPHVDSPPEPPAESPDVQIPIPPTHSSQSLAPAPPEVAPPAPPVSPQPPEPVSEGREKRKRVKNTLYPPEEYEVNRLSLEKAIRNLGATALEAIDKELAQMEEKLVYTPIKPADLKKYKFTPIPSSMFVTEKKDPMGVITRCKARLAAGGHKQLKDPSRSLYSPTMSSSSKLTIIAIAASEGRHVVVCDIAGAYLLAEMTELVLMKIAPALARRICLLFPKYKEFLDEKGGITVKLLKALYGCVQSAKLWFNTIKDLLLSLGYSQNERDACVFNRGVNSIQITLGLFVDDLLITSKDKTLIEELLSHLVKTFKRIQINRGDQHDYLGHRITLDRSNRSVTFAMKGFINSIIEKHGTTSVSSSPANSDLLQISKTTNNTPLSPEKQRDLHSTIPLCCQPPHLACQEPCRGRS